MLGTSGYKLERAQGIKWTAWPASSRMACWALLSPGHKPCCGASGGEIKDASLNALLRKLGCSVLVGKDTTYRPQNAPFKAGEDGEQNIAETFKQKKLSGSMQQNYRETTRYSQCKGSVLKGVLCLKTIPVQDKGWEKPCPACSQDH